MHSRQDTGGEARRSAARATMRRRFAPT
jgi:hypothetical protein